MLRVSIGTGSSVSIVTLAIVDRVVSIVGLFVMCSVVDSAVGFSETVGCNVDSEVGLAVVSWEVREGFLVVGDWIMIQPSGVVTGVHSLSV